MLSGSPSSGTRSRSSIWEIEDGRGQGHCRDELKAESDHRPQEDKIMQDSSSKSRRTDRLVNAIDEKLRSKAATLDQSHGPVKITAHPQGQGFTVDVDVKL